MNIPSSIIIRGNHHTPIKLNSIPAWKWSKKNPTWLELVILSLSFPVSSDHFMVCFNLPTEWTALEKYIYIYFCVFVEARTSMKEHRNPELTCQLWNEVTTEINSASMKNKCLIVTFEKEVVYRTVYSRVDCSVTFHNSEKCICIKFFLYL